MKTSSVPRHSTPARLPGLLLGLLLGIAATVHAEDNTTNIISGFGFDVGNNDLVIGASGINNYGQVDSAGSVFNVADTYIGLDSAANSNAILVTDSGSSLQVNNQYFVGFSGSFNNLTVANGGIASGSGANNFIGNDAASTGNSVLVTGAGSAWQLAGVLQVGNGGTSNSLTIANGGAVTNNSLGLVGVALGADGNSILVTGSGSIWVNTELQQGVRSSGNTLTVAAGARVLSSGSTLTGRIGAHTDGTSGNNTVVVTGAGSLWQNDGFVFVGEYGSSNTVVITDGGKVAAPRMIVGAGAPGFPLPNYCTMVVSGPGSAFVQTNSTGTNTGNARVGGEGSFARLIVTNGGLFHLTASGSRLGGGASGSNATALVSGSGSIWRNDGEFNVGRAGSGNNTLTIADGGVVQSVLGTIGAAGCSNNTVTITGAGSLWDVGGADLNIPRSGAAGVANNVLNLINGGRITNVASVNVIGPGTAISLSNGSIYAGTAVMIGNGASLTGNGTINGPITVSSGGTLAPGNSIGTLTANNALTLNTGSTALMEVDKANGTNDAVVGLTTVSYNGTLTVNNLGGAFVVGDTYKLFSATSYVGNFSATNLPALNVGLKWVWTPTSGTLSVVSTTPGNIAASLSGSTLTLAWPPLNLGWIAQSNSVSVADSGSWFDIANSQTGTNLNVTINPAQANVFYRLRLP